MNEYNVLRGKDIHPLLFVHPLTKLTCYWDVAWNRLTEKMNGHGSCGIGVGATMSRQEQSPYKLHVIDLLNKDILREKLKQIGRFYGDKIKDLNSENGNYFLSEALKEQERFRDAIGSAFMKSLIGLICTLDTLKLNYDEIIFEGSQGILLDMEHGIFPNVTYSSTTSRNALQICRNLGLDMGNVEIYYVTRSYLTRHGTGWFPENPVKLVNNEQETNVWNEWQQSFRVSELDYPLLNHSLAVDSCYSHRCGKNLVVTCMDQRKNFVFPTSWYGRRFKTVHQSWSPDSKDFRQIL